MVDPLIGDCMNVDGAASKGTGTRGGGTNVSVHRRASYHLIVIGVKNV